MTTRRTPLGRRLREAPVPDEEATRERAWRVVAAAHAERGRVSSDSRPGTRRMIIAAAAAVAAAVVGLSPAGATVGHWVRGVLPSEPTPSHVRPALGALPGHGRLLVAARTGAWIVESDGSRRRLGAYDDAAFSPRGLFVAATRGRLLSAVDPRGDVRWTVTAASRVSTPTWSPDGFRVAYRSGSEVRVIYGDGARDRRVARRSAPVAPAWQPRAGHRLAFADGRRVVLRDADDGRVVWRTEPIAGVRQLAWSPGGRRLLVVSEDGVWILRADGHVAAVAPPVAGTQVRRVAWLPAARRFAILYDDSVGSRSDVVLARTARPRAGARALLAVPGRLTGLIASPDGRWLLLRAPAARQWLLVRTAGPGRLTALSRVGHQFDPGGGGRAPTPRPLAWIR
jgi:hypothetical protein